MFEDKSKLRKEHSGLCSTCQYAPTCIYLKDSEVTVWQCAEFDGFCETKNRTTGKDFSHPKNLQHNLGSIVKKSEKYRGLCTNCENREICQFRKPEWGVWQCGEYR